MSRRTRVLAILIVLGFLLVTNPVSGTTSPQESVNLYSGNKLIVSSDQAAIKSVIVRGNLSAANIPNVAYPAKNFTITTNTTQLYTLNVWLSYPSPYKTAIIINDPSSKTSSHFTDYYTSGGDLNLTIYTSFQTPPTTGTGAPIGWSSFFGWFSQFGNAFPIWIKILYMVLGAQFAFVGYRWIKFEDEKRRIEGHLPPLDRGNKAYLWTDIVFRTLLAGFVISLALMVGEIIVISVAQYLFLVNLNLFSLVDFFSLFFVAVLGTLLYLTREGLDRFFDLKPMMED